MKNKIKSHIRNVLIKDAIEYKKHFDPETGRFMDYVVMKPEGRRVPEEGKDWWITNQDPVLTFAYLYKTDCPDNPFYRDEETLDMILKAVGAWRDFQYEDGTVEFIKGNGECWGAIYMPWSWYHWLETYILLADDLSDETKKDWQIGLFPGFESFARQNPEEIHNIPVWQAMCVHRAGQYFGRQDWIDGGDALIANACKVQHRDGFWAEHKGPTVGYNAVYMYALGMYYAHGGKVDVLPALRKSTSYMQMFTYPSGAGVDTIDGRVHYAPAPKGKLTAITALPAYAATRGGLAYVNKFLFEYKTNTLELPRLASFLLALDMIDDARVDEYVGMAGFDLPDFTGSYGSATVVRKNNSQITLSAYTAPLTESRWGMDRQSFVSIWTEDADLLMGSGNSKNHIQLSTFVIADGRGEVLSYIPSAGQVLRDGAVSLDYEGYAEGCIEGEILDCGKIKLIYSAKLADSSYRWRISLPLFADFEIEKETYRAGCKDGKNFIDYKGWRVSFDGDFKLESPLRPFNPYVKDGASERIHYLLAVNVYPQGDVQEVTFEKIGKDDLFFDDGFVPTNNILSSE